MTSLTIFILCHNRPHDTREVIKSVMRQSDRDFHLIVSDNSSNDEVEKLIQHEFAGVRYVRRKPMVPVLVHLNLCIAEAEDDYFCLFHDDDLMEEDFVCTVKKYSQRYPEAAEIGCNAHIERFGKREARPSFRSFRNQEVIIGQRDLAMRYFGRNQSGIAPFPGYVYNRKLVGEHRFPVDGGKYSDVSWLMMLASLGPVVWINKPLMTYRLHSSNDGTIESFRDRLRFLAHLKRNRHELGNGVLQEYRSSFIYKPLIKASDQSQHRQHVATRFLRRQRWTRYVRLDTYLSLVKRALVKWMTRA